jgi:hypothetical protein
MKNSIKPLLVLSLIVPAAHGASTLGYEFGFYGFLKSSATFSDGALASFNNINHAAPTHAVVRTTGLDKSSRLSFQTQQSRAGLNLTKAQTSAKVELDFIDFSKSSPTTQMVPRIRIASITHKLDDSRRIHVGQDWDLFSPHNNFTFNHVGNYFMAGNTGFMRQQAQFHKKSGEWETGLALGMAGSNPGVSDSDLEYGKSPTYAIRFTRTLTEGKIGVSGIYTTLNYETTNNSRRDSYGYNFFYKNKYGAFSVDSEAYFGQNLANIGTLALAKGTNMTNVKEYGATLSGLYNLNEKHNILGGIGFARIDNPSELSPFALGATGVISAPGVRSNLVTRIGHEMKLTSDLSWFTEVSRYETDSKISVDKYKLEIAYGLESGLQLKF